MCFHVTLPAGRSQGGLQEMANAAPLANLCAGKSWGSRGGLQEMDDAMIELLQEPAGRQLQTGELNMQDMITEEKMQVSTLQLSDRNSC